MMNKKSLTLVLIILILVHSGVCHAYNLTGKKQKPEKPNSDASDLIPKDQEAFTTGYAFFEKKNYRKAIP